MIVQGNTLLPLSLNPSSGDVGISQTIKCVIENWNPKGAAPWVSWDDEEIAPESVLSEEVYINRPDGRPNHKARVQVYSFKKPITEVAIYTYHKTGNQLTILVN